MAGWAASTAEESGVGERACVGAGGGAHRFEATPELFPETPGGRIPEELSPGELIPGGLSPEGRS